MNNDSVEYMAQANNIVNHGSFYASNWDLLPHNPAFYSLRPPLYGLFVLITLTLTSNPFVLLFFQSLISVFIWVMLRDYILKFIPSINEGRVHVFLILGLVLNPVQLILCNSIFSDILFQFFLTMAFFAILNFITLKQTRYFLYYTVFCVLALLTKPALVYYAYINILLACYFYFKVQRHWTIIAYAALLPLVIFIVSSINKNVTGYYHFSASKTENLWTYNTTEFLNMEYGHDSGLVYRKEIWERGKAQADFKRQYQFVDSACTHVLLQNINRYAVYHAQGMLNFFIAPGREFINGYLNKDEAEPKRFIKELNINGWAGVKNYFASQPMFLFFANILITFWNVFLLLGLLAFTCSKRVPPDIKIMVLLIVFYMAGVSSLAIGTARYKAAIYPILLFANAFLLVVSGEQ